MPISQLAMPDNNLIMQFAQQAPQIGQAFDQHRQAAEQQQIARYQLGQQLQTAAQLKAAQQAYITNPSAQNLNTLITLDPKSAEAIKSGHTALDLDTQKAQLRQATYVRSLLAQGKPDQAAAALQQRIDADRAAGHDTTDDEHMLEVIKADPKQAGAAIDYHLASILGPEKWGENFKALGSEARDNAELPGKLALQPATLAKTQADAELAKAQAGQITDPRPETAVVTDPTTGQPIFYDKNGSPEAARASAGAGGGSASVPQGINALIPALMTSENASGDPNAKNPNSSATGNGQFVDATWLGMVKQNRPDLAKGKSDAQILAMRADPNLSREMTTRYAVQNAGALETAGLPVNGATIAMCHKLGPGGAQAVLGADPNAPLTKVLPPAVIAANPQLRGLTAGQYAQGLAKKFGAQPIDTAAGGDPAATGEEFLKALPTGRANVIKAMADGRMAVPTGAAARSAANQQILAQLAQYDPSFDFANSSSRRATRVNFTSGKASNEIKALNTAIGHLGALDDAIDGLGNYGLPANNAAAHAIARATGTAARLKKFEVTKNAALDEVNKIFTGSAGALADREEWKKQLNATGSPDDLHSVVGQIAELVHSRIEALGEQYSQGMGTSKDGLELLTPHAREAFGNLGKSREQRRGGAASVGQPTPGAVQATAGDVALLRKNPNLAPKFDQLYGQGASAQYLGAR